MMVDISALPARLIDQSSYRQAKGSMKDMKKRPGGRIEGFEGLGESTFAETIVGGPSEAEEPEVDSAAMPMRIISRKGIRHH
jgi:hypothetical protein